MNKKKSNDTNPYTVISTKPVKAIHARDAAPFYGKSTFDTDARESAKKRGSKQ